MNAQVKTYTPPCDCGRGGISDLWHRTDCPQWRSMDAMLRDRRDMAEALRKIANQSAQNYEDPEQEAYASRDIARAALAKAGL